MIRWERELTVFGMLVRVSRLFSQNVAVSKSRHRLLFYPRALRYLLKVFSEFAFLCVCGFEISFCLKRSVSAKSFVLF